MKIAIQGHPTRGKEVIQILESLGGKNAKQLTGKFVTFYYINDENKICDDHKKYLPTTCKLYTLEEFEKEFPFKVGDKVVCKATQQIPHTIVGISWDSFACMRYEIKEDKTGIITHCPTNLLIKYKEMKEERNITLTLEKAQEWYKKGGELREIALQAYSEEELTKVDLPKTWEEFCENYPVQKGECWLSGGDDIKQYSYSVDRLNKNWIPSMKSAKAHLAMIQLEQLRNYYRGIFVTVIGMPIWCIIRWRGKLIVEQRVWGTNETFLTFQSKEVAEEYLKNFKPLIEKAGDLIE